MIQTRIFSVAEINREIKQLLESVAPFVQVSGEISNFRPHYSGHAYFTLKDRLAQMSAVMWRTYAGILPFDLADGKQVICRGYLSVYEKTGRYQLIVQSMKEAGTGQVHRQLEDLKLALMEKGYFDTGRKRPIPAYPACIGLVTSPTGAALQDMLTVARERNPGVQLWLRPAQVQGLAAAVDIAQAIGDLNRQGEAEVIVIGRGGGAVEDLWAFNEKVVADAIFHSRIPVVSAVGHEVDFTIADRVADLRAPTPTAAMEAIVPQREDMLSQLRYCQEQLQGAFRQKLNSCRQKLDTLSHHYALRKPQQRLLENRSRLGQLRQMLERQLRSCLADKHSRLFSLEKQLQALGPEQILARGYVILRQGGQVVDRPELLQLGPATLTFRGRQTMTFEITRIEESHG